MTQLLRVLYIEYSVGFGGSIKSLSLALRGLKDVQPLVLTSQEPDLARTWFGEHANRTFRRVVNYHSVELTRNWFDSHRRYRILRTPVLKSLAIADLSLRLKNTLWLAWLIRHHKIDLVHLNNGFIPAEAIMATRWLKVPCIVHMRGFPSRSGVKPHRILDHVAAVITVSDAVGEAFDPPPVPRDRFTTIHNPVDLDRIAAAASRREPTRARYGLEPDNVVAAIFGRVIPWKGQIVFVQAMIEAMRAVPNLRGMIVGDESDGGRDYYEEIQNLIRASGMADRFVLAGYQKEVESYYAAADIVVHASVAPEPFGRVLPEGMAAQRVVVAADAGGPCEVITHGHDGLLVAPGDVAALTRVLCALANDPAERQRLATNAYRTAQERFGIDASAAAVRAVYDRVLARSNIGPDSRAVMDPEAIEVS